MINKVTGYAGFRSYGELQYPTMKQGKELEVANKVWQSTSRPSDQVSQINNFHYQKSQYRHKYLQNTLPKDYHPEHVPKGGQTSLNFSRNNITKAYDKQEAQKNMNPGSKNYLLQTGTQHWKSNYQHQYNLKSLSKTQNQNWNYKSKGLSLDKNAMGNNNGHGGNGNVNVNNFGNSANGINSSNLSLTGNKFDQSGKGINSSQNNKNALKNKAYINNCKTGQTQYKFTIGHKIGFKPTDILNQYSRNQPLINNPLKHGTNQLWTQIPGYQGFKPSQMPFNELKKKIQQRKSINKGNPKVNLTDNYHINIPGYSGFTPKYTVLQNQLRQSCLSYK